jgi:hypothetical protein
MQVERPRARRYLFAASIELFDLDSEAEINEQTADSQPVRVSCERSEALGAWNEGPVENCLQECCFHGFGSSG